MNAIDVMQTRKCLSLPNCYEANPVFGKRPSTTKLITGKLLGTGLVYLIADYDSVYRTETLMVVNLIQFLTIRHNYFVIGI